MFYANNIMHALVSAYELLSEVVDNPRLEAELLLAHVLQQPRVYLPTHPEAVLTEDQVVQYTKEVKRRVNGVPLPYITGMIEFHGMSFKVTPDVLIPRPETEMLVELASTWLATRPNAVTVDVGTGSGCIAVTLVQHTKCQTIVATDISLSALRVARQNAACHLVSDKIHFVNCDLLRPVQGPVDVILSNPPYIAEHEWDTIPMSIHHEPRTALLAGTDGLQVIKRLLHQASEILTPDGLLLVEIGAQQGKAASALAQAAFPNALIHVLKDFSGLDRVVRICRGENN